MQETEEAIAALERHPNLRSESYLSPLNGTSAKCAAGVPESRVTQHCLKTGGFPPTEAGFEEAILAGWAQINVEAGGRVVLGTGKAAVEYWRGRGTDTTVSFNVNPPEPRLRLVTAKRQSGEFVVDCISTDGGGIPRNVIVDMGLSLVRLQALSLAEFVRKTSTNPAKILGLKNKGHFGPDADADITVLDLARQKAVLGMANGQLVMYQGHVCGRGGRFITTAAGVAAVRERGCSRSWWTWRTAPSIGGKMDEERVLQTFLTPTKSRGSSGFDRLPAASGASLRTQAPWKPPSGGKSRAVTRERNRNPALAGGLHAWK